MEDISIKIIQEEFENIKNDKKGLKKDFFGLFMDQKKSKKIYAKYFYCEFCNKPYKTEQIKKRHMKKTCRVKKQALQLEKMNKLVKENEELKEKINMSATSVNNNIVNNIHTINNNNNNNTINNVNNITINNYGSENLDYITEQYIQKLLDKNPIQAIRILIKNIHYHPEHPENHNIKITASNRKYNVASIWKDNQWVLRDRRSVIDDIVNKSYNILDDEYIKSIEDGEKTKFNEFQNKYEKPDKSVHKNLKKEAELIILNGTKTTKKIIN